MIHHAGADVSVLLLRKFVSPSDSLQWSDNPIVITVSVSVLDQQARSDDRRQIERQITQY